MTAPTDLQRPSSARRPAARNFALSFLNAFSMGLRSGLDGDNRRNRHPARLSCWPTPAWHANSTVPEPSNQPRAW